MQGEAARGWNLDPRRAPEPPVTTRRIHSEAPDPGAASGQLPPFRSGSMDASRTDIAEGPEQNADGPLEPTPGVDIEPIADVLLGLADETLGSTADAPVELTVDDVGVEPVADLLPDPEAQPELDPSTVAREAGRADQTDQMTRADTEETWLLDEIVEPDEEPRDALGEALQDAVTRAAPPFAEDLVRSAEWTDPTGIEGSTAAAPPPDPLAQRAHVGSVDAEMSGARRRPSTATPSADGFTEDLATTLESLAIGLRARGFNALDDAFARGDRLESSLALFLAGYRAGRGE